MLHPREPSALWKTYTSPKDNISSLSTTIMNFSLGCRLLRNLIHSSSLPLPCSQITKILSVYLRKQDGTIQDYMFKMIHRPAQKRGVLASLVCRTRTIANEESFLGELKYLEKSFFSDNGYSPHDINCALRNTGTAKRSKDMNKTKGHVLLLFYGTMPVMIGRLVRKF